MFDGFTPVSSRNNSTLDLSQASFVPYRGHSKKPSYGQSETSIPAQVIGHSPIRNPVPIEEVYGGNNHTEQHVRRSSHMNNNYQDAPKLSQNAPSRTTSSGSAPPKLRRVHTMQPIGVMFPSSSGLSSESLNNSQQEIRTSSGKVQETLDSAFSEDEKNVNEENTIL